MNHQYLSFDKINNLSDWWLENSKSRNVEIAALEPLIWKSGDNNIIDVVRIFKEKGGGSRVVHASLRIPCANRK